MGTNLGTVFFNINFLTMIKVSFLHRGTSKDKISSIYVRIRSNTFDIKTPIPFLACKPTDWKGGKCKNSSLKMNNDDEDSINVQLARLESKILNAYKKDTPETNITAWLNEQITPTVDDIIDTSISENLIEYFEGYINRKKANVTSETLKTIRYCKRVLSNYEDYLKENRKTFKSIKFTDLSNNFRIGFEKYCSDLQYSLSTVNKITRTLKSVAKDAKSKEIPIHPHIVNWYSLSSIDKNKPKSVYLSLDELKIISEKEMPNNYLDNARDWLIVACFTGQRVSDYLRFTKEMIVDNNDGRRYLEFKQKKTNKEMRIPILEPVEKIIEKNGGEFPHSISSVKLNLYIKKVCEISGINEMVFNSKAIVFVEDEEEGESFIRKKLDYYPKYELITSHIGRKSFATNFYGIMSIATLMFFSGHTTQKQFLDYISKTSDEEAKSTSDEFKKLGL